MWINHCYIERTNCVKRYITFTKVFLIELFHSYTHHIVDKMQTFNLHLVSDSTGDTVSSVARAALVQFEGVEAEEHVWTLVRTRGQIDKVLEKIEEKPGIVMFTIADYELRSALKEGCDRLNIVSISVLSRVVKEFTNYLGVQVSGEMGKQYELDEEYFDRVDAINFALTHDDGQSVWDIERSDIVIVGVSRTSKSPTCMYLAFRGYKVANIPYVMDCQFPLNMDKLYKTMVIGLTISPERLREIRRNRLFSLHEEKETDYVDIDRIKEELKEMRLFLTKNNIPVIDVTRKSVEETSATIIQHHKKFLENRRKQQQAG